MEREENTLVSVLVCHCPRLEVHLHNYTTHNSIALIYIIYNCCTVPMSSYWSRFDGHNHNNNNNRRERWITTVPRPLLHQQMDVDGELQPWRMFEERVRTGPFGLSRFPLQPFSPVRILILNGNGGSGSNTNTNISPRLRGFVQNSPPRIRSEWNVWTAPELAEYEAEAAAGLTDGEFKSAMKQLKKKVYQPIPLKKPQRQRQRQQRRGLFGSSKSMTNEIDVEIIGEAASNKLESCSICLEAFVANEHVLVTPCKHTFHDGCITPWVKSHGKCPICRFPFCQRTPQSQSQTTTTSIIPHSGDNSSGLSLTDEEEQLALELVALIRAMEEAFNWLNLNSTSPPLSFH